MPGFIFCPGFGIVQSSRQNIQRLGQLGNKIVDGNGLCFLQRCHQAGILTGNHSSHIHSVKLLQFDLVVIVDHQINLLLQIILDVDGGAGVGRQAHHILQIGIGQIGQRVAVGMTGLHHDDLIGTAQHKHHLVGRTGNGCDPVHLLGHVDLSAQQVHHRVGLNIFRRGSCAAAHHRQHHQHRQKGTQNSLHNRFTSFSAAPGILPGATP